MSIEGPLTVAGGISGAVFIPSGASDLERIGLGAAGGGIAFIGGLVALYLLRLIWGVWWAPSWQRDEARARWKELEQERQRPELFDVVWPSNAGSIGLPINTLDDGTWQASAASFGVSPIQLIHRSELTMVNRVTPNAGGALRS